MPETPGNAVDKLVHPLRTYPPMTPVLDRSDLAGDHEHLRLAEAKPEHLSNLGEPFSLTMSRLSSGSGGWPAAARLASSKACRHLPRSAMARMSRCASGATAGSSGLTGSQAWQVASGFVAEIPSVESTHSRWSCLWSANVLPDHFAGHQHPTPTDTEGFPAVRRAPCSSRASCPAWLP